jgi:hypothetical protein
MSTPPISQRLRTAIEQVHPTLPTVLGPAYASFTAQLEAFLAQGSEDQVFDLFRQYPEAYSRLLDALVQQQEETETTKGGLGLFGYPIMPQPAIRYRCKVGPHDVAGEDVKRRDAAGNALCPVHNKPMVLEGESEPDQEKE